VKGLAQPAETADPEYAEGLQAAIAAAVNYWISGLRRSGIRPDPVPTALLSQARLAARNGVALDTVVRRYVAGHSMLADYLIQEAEQMGPIPAAALKRLLRRQAALLDRILGAVGEEYSRERTESPRTVEQHRAERVKRILAGELLDSADLAYPFGGFHVGIVASGSGAADAVADLAECLDSRKLKVRPGEDTAWIWLGFRRRPEQESLQDLMQRARPAGMAIAIGEPGDGLRGWRLTHFQAQAALAIARRGESKVVRYGEVALVAAARHDRLLAASLGELYLRPLKVGRDGGAVLRETLRAYFDCERNVSAAASKLGVTRQTIKNRLQVAQERVGPYLSGTGTEMEIALRLDAATAQDPR